jgi:hypothetical protein
MFKFLKDFLKISFIFNKAFVNINIIFHLKFNIFVNLNSFIIIYFILVFNKWRITAFTTKIKWRLIYLLILRKILMLILLGETFLKNKFIFIFTTIFWTYYFIFIIKWFWLFLYLDKFLFYKNCNYWFL